MLENGPLLSRALTCSAAAICAQIALPTEKVRLLELNRVTTLGTRFIYGDRSDVIYSFVALSMQEALEGHRFLMDLISIRY